MSILNLTIPTITVLNNKPSETQWDIVRITNDKTCPKIHTIAVHNLKAGEKIYITGTNCEPSVDGLRTVYQVFDNTTFSLRGHDTTKNDGGTSGVIIRENYLRRRNEIIYE